MIFALIASIICNVVLFALVVVALAKKINGIQFFIMFIVLLSGIMTSMGRIIYYGVPMEPL